MLHTCTTVTPQCWYVQEGFEDLIANDEEVEAAAEENQQLYQRREAELQRRDNEMSDEQLEEFVRKRFENRSYEVIFNAHCLLLDEARRPGRCERKL